MFMKKMYGLAAGCVGMAALLTACTPQVSTNVPNVIRVENVDAGDEGKVTINSSDSVEVTPDMAEIVYGITTEDDDASACQQKNTEALNQVLAFLKEQGYEEDFSDSRLHHEIYLSDPRRAAPEKLRTVVRHPVK